MSIELFEVRLDEEELCVPPKLGLADVEGGRRPTLVANSDSGELLVETDREVHELARGSDLCSECPKR